MSKTRSTLYAKGYRAGRRLTKGEQLKWFFTRRRTECEEWFTDKDEKSMFGFWLVVAALFAVAGIIILAGIEK